MSRPSDTFSGLLTQTRRLTMAQTSMRIQLDSQEYLMVVQSEYMYMNK